MSDNPATILVIIATYNRADLLPDAIDSVLTQDYPDLRIAVIDDGSTDGTEALCRDYAERHPGIVLYRRKNNGGCSSARNAGLELLDGTFVYVAFLDSDDCFLPGKLVREVALLEKYPAAGFTYADSIIFQEETGKERRQQVAAAGHPEAFALEHFLTNEAKNSALLYRAEILGSRRFRTDLRYNEDSEFLQRIALDHDGVYCPEPGCWVRSHPGSKSRNLLGIAQAVYVASRDILADCPGFHSMHRAVLERRMRRIRKELFAELAAVGAWVEAAESAAGPWQKLVVVAHLGACYRLRKQVIAQLGALLRRVRGYSK